jgi:hypothetical protein
MRNATSPVLSARSSHADQRGDLRFGNVNCPQREGAGHGHPPVDTPRPPTTSGVRSSLQKSDQRGRMGGFAASVTNDPGV